MNCLRRVGVAALAALAVAPAARAQAVCPNGPLAPGEDCERFADCCRQGTRCFRKSGGFAGCLASCTPGFDDGDGTPWDCTELSCSAGMPVYPPVDNSGALARHGKPRLQGLQLVNQAGTPMQLTGMVSSEAVSSSCVTADALRLFSSSWGVNVITIRVEVGKDGQAAPVTADEINRIKIIASDALAAGMYAIINFGVYTPGDPNDFLTSVSPAAGPAIDFWREIATTYKDSAHVLYEIAGEPNGPNDGPSWSRLKRYHDAVIGEIRKIDPATIILAGTPLYNQKLEGPATEPVAQPANVMYTQLFAARSDSLDVIKGRIEPYRKSIPILVQNAKPTDHGGVLGPRLDVLKSALDFLGPRPDAPSISWLASELDDRERNENLFQSGVCAAKQFDQLTCSGYFVRNYIRFLKQGIPTLAPTTSPTRGPTRPGETQRPTGSPQAAVVVPPGGSGPTGAPTRAVEDDPDAAGFPIVPVAVGSAVAGFLCVGLGLVAGRRSGRSPPLAKAKYLRSGATDASSVETGSRPSTMDSFVTVGSNPSMGSRAAVVGSAELREAAIAERARPPPRAPTADWRTTRSSVMPSFVFKRFAPSFVSTRFPSLFDTGSHTTFEGEARRPSV